MAPIKYWLIQMKSVKQAIISQRYQYNNNKEIKMCYYVVGEHFFKLRAKFSHRGSNSSMVRINPPDYGIRTGLIVVCVCV